ncbi:MAG: AAA family ATPase [Planctomycetota bacterium]|nr:AAA family ATPase [Planctomycetota bacterium]
MGKTFPWSTVGTLTGTLDLLRLLYARVAEDPGGVSLTRSHFSFNHPDGACARCGGSGVEDEVSEDLLVEDASKSLRGGALKPTLKNGYTVYSQVTLEVMDTICRAHGFDVETPWRELSDEQRGVILRGTRRLKVPFGKHSIESRMKWEGITARPREEGYYRGLIPVIEETLKRNRNPNILRFARSVPCAECDGTRLSRPGREAAIGSRRLPELLRLSARELGPALDAVDEIGGSEVAQAILPELHRRLERMVLLELGHLSLGRESTTLSTGEAQRIQLASQLAAPMGGLLVALDEPTVGLHPSGQPGMTAVLDELRNRGNTLMVVEHDPDMVRQADHVVEVGPGAGPEGGLIVRSEPMSGAPLGEPPVKHGPRRDPSGELRLVGATLHNLRGADLTVHLGTLQVITGPSGAGKSSLVFGTLLPALAGAEGGGFERLEGAEGQRVRAVDARPIGRTPRSTPATWSGLMDLIRKRFAATEEAAAAGLGASHFSFNSKEGRCPVCEGLGVQRVGLHLLEDLELECDACGGARYRPEPLTVPLREKTVADVLALTVAEARDFFADDPPALALCAAMDDLGLGHVPLGFPSNRLSRGEAQRVKLATLLGEAGSAPTLVALDEPDRGLHPVDVERLVRSLGRLIEAGHTVLAISHHRSLWAAADRRVDVVDGVARPVAPGVGEAPARARAPRPPAEPPRAIQLRGVRTHNLRSVDVDFPRGGVTAVCGVSGSGKTSLAFDTLAGEAWQRFSESLPFQVRRHMKRLARPELDGAEGLGPVISLRQQQARAGQRSTVATQSELGPLLRLLFSRAGTIDGAPVNLQAEHFSPDRAAGACAVCEGVGTVSRCDPERLITDPSRPITAGAMDGTRVGKYLGEADGQFLATLRAAAPSVDWDQPFAELDVSARDLALRGAGSGEVLRVQWELAAGGQVGEGKGTHEFEATWDGLLALAEREAQRRVKQKSFASWAEPLAPSPCMGCGGTRLGPLARSVVLGGRTLPDLLDLSVDQLLDELDALELSERQASLVAALRPEFSERVGPLVSLGLGHLQLSRKSPTLSGGELQRTRLASVLRAGLAGVTLVLDEPTSGLHAQDVEGLMGLLRAFTDDGNTVVLVEHDPGVLGAADHLVELGPGAGDEGGEVVAAGPPPEVLSGDGPTARALAAAAAAGVERKPVPLDWTLAGCRAHHLKGIDVALPSAGLVAVTGVSGSGKSSLVFDVIEPSVRAGRPVQCDGVGGIGGRGALPSFAEIKSSRRPTEASTVVTAMGLMGSVQSLFAAEAEGSGLARGAFSFTSPAGRCPGCRGSGRERVPMDFMADLDLSCPDCGGRRYRPEVLGVRWGGRSIADFMAASVAELHGALADEAVGGKLSRGLESLLRLDLGHLSLGRAVSELSGGEVQRLTLAAGLVTRAGPTLHLLDEPATGLHEADVQRLVEVLRELAGRGDLILMAEHRLSLIAACDHVVDLGPSSGEGGGRLVACGPPGTLMDGATAAALRGR